ncbi:MAG: hypothetical protein KIH10_16650, partial [Candidatus Freyarchaeota archaeon]|nr:hypothetical protein [Candidatus Jordarchaeia archaeon]
RAVIEAINKSGYGIVRQERTVKTIDSTKKTYLHIFLKTPQGYETEIVIHPLEDINLREKCEIFGDDLKGLKLKALEEIMRNDPLKKFIPH